MREILFRGKKYNGEWEYGYPCFGGLNNEVAFMYTMHSCSSQVTPETIGQYTGLTDKNGTKIFEGDIVRHYNRPYETDYFYIGVIEWNEEEFRFANQCIKENRQYLISNQCVYEVIGNIHDNPELLKGE